MTLEIRIYGDPVLKKKARAVTEKTLDEVRKLADVMAQTMYGAGDGIGLAAPQVGESVRLVVMDVDWITGDSNAKKKRKLRVFVNPEVVWESDEDCSYEEGCLSIPGVRSKVYRPARVRVKFRDLDYAEHEIEAEGLLARCLQHEIDHLDGTLFVDRLGLAQRTLVAGKLNRLRKESRKRMDARKSGKEGGVPAWK